MNSPRPDQLMTIAEVADVLRVGQRTVYRWIEDNKLPAVCLAGRTLRVWRKALYAWLESSQSEAAPPAPPRAVQPRRERWEIAPKSWDSPRRPKGEDDDGTDEE